MIKKIVGILLLFILIGNLFSSVIPISSIRAAQSNDPTNLPMTKSKENANVYYTVGLYWTAIWTDSSGNWIADPATGVILKPGSHVPQQHMSYTYGFDFPGRKVKSVDVYQFKINMDSGGVTGKDKNLDFGEEVFRTARYGKGWAEYSSAVSDKPYKPVRINWTGKGTSSANATVQTDGILSAPRPVDLTEGGNFAPKVEGWEYYFPVLFRVELEPEEGKAEYRHFTKDGKSLDGVDGFKNFEEKMPKGKDYIPKVTPGTAKHKYVGYKKSTVSVPSGGSIQSGSPPELKPYKGDFPVYYINYYYEGDTPDQCKPGDPKCSPPPSSGQCIDPTPGQSIPGEDLNPNVSAVIKADSRGAEKFDVLQGIPTSESIYGNVLSKNYLYKNNFVEMTGECTYSVPVTKEYTLTWDPGKEVKNANGKGTHTEPDPQQDTESKTSTYEVKRKYSFWVIDNLEIYKIDKAELKNYAFASGSITIQPSGYNPPTYSINTSGTHYTPPNIPSNVTAPPGSVSGGKSRPSVPDEDLSSYAEKAVGKVKVQNDYLQFNGSTIMSNTPTEEKGPTPTKIPSAPQIGQNVLYSPNNVIPNTKANKANQPSTGTIFYNIMDGNINGGSDKQTEINGINPITVHTPVVDYAVIPDTNRPFDQRMEPNMNRVVLILDRPFTLTFTERGQHRNIPGYGNNDYKKYTLQKRVTFPFGVYNADKSVYYPENTWINIPVGQDHTTFQMPTWINEGTYHVTTQAWAVNSQGIDGCQQNYNGDLKYYCATEGFDVDVVGRLFGFRIWDIGDFRYENIFRSSKGSVNHTASAYFSGGRDENGNPTNIYGKNTWILPIRPGSHPKEKATVPHNGYSFLFDFKTIGNLWNVGEGIRIDPTFYYVPKTGGAAKQVDLYYDVTGNSSKMIKVGSANDKKTFTRYYQLPDKMRNISSTELTKAAQYEYNHILSPAQHSSTSWDKFWKKYGTRKINIGAGYDNELLSYQARTLIGPTSIPSVVDPTVALRSVQHWYGEYNLPIAPYILPKGTNLVAVSNKYGGKLTGREKEFLKNGYIMVHFEIYTLKNNNQSKEILGYHAPIANMWAIEGQVSSAQDYLGHKFTFQPGDIAMFESDFSVRNDYQGQGR